MAQKGKDILLKIGNGADPEVFTTIAGLRSKTIALNGEAVDVTTADSTNNWRELLAGAGVQSMTLTGSGVFKDGSSQATVLTAKTAQTVNNYEALIPGLGTFAGPFLVASVQVSGEYNAEAQVQMTLESAGAITFTAVS